ncbi:MAG TPA: DUF6624 domain-containing protein [Acidobacteriaceae bacterium]|nr:DUF6624 domain-containing protein [Acidobacteriaceae bacterium]
MTNQALRLELLAMETEDRRTRQELFDAGALGDQYVPRLQQLHARNAARLHEIISTQGWPHQDLVGTDGAEAAWLIVQHAIGEPDFQRQALVLLKEQAAQGRVPAWHGAYLEDRIAMYEDRPQRYGTQWIDDPIDGRIRPWPLAEPVQVNEQRASVGLGPLRPVPELGPELSHAEQQTIKEKHRWWRQWLASRGWLAKDPSH